MRREGSWLLVFFLFYSVDQWDGNCEVSANHQCMAQSDSPSPPPPSLPRPPGHHAESTCCMGFCIFNNVAIAAKIALDKHSLKR